MAFLYAIENLIIILMILIVATQIVLPLWKGELTFPMFRRRRKRAETSIANAREDADIRSLQSTADRIRKGAEK